MKKYFFVLYLLMSFVLLKAQVTTYTVYGKTMFVVFSFPENYSQELLYNFSQISKLSYQYNQDDISSVKTKLKNSIDNFVNLYRNNNFENVECPQVEQIRRLHSEMADMYSLLLKQLCFNLAPQATIQNTYNEFSKKQKDLNGLVIDCMNVMLEDINGDYSDDVYGQDENSYSTNKYEQLKNTIQGNIDEVYAQQEYLEQTRPQYLNEDFESNSFYYEQNANSVDNEEVAEDIIGEDIDVNQYENTGWTTDTVSSWEAEDDFAWDPMQTVEKSGWEDTDSSSWQEPEKFGWDSVDTQNWDENEILAENYNFDNIQDEIQQNNIQEVKVENQNAEIIETNEITELSEGEALTEQYPADNTQIEQYAQVVEEEKKSAYNNLNSFINDDENEDTDDEEKVENEVAVQVSVANEEESYIDAGKKYITNKWNQITNMVSSTAVSFLGMADYYKNTFDISGDAVNVIADPNATDAQHDEMADKSMDNAEDIKDRNFGFIFDW